MLGFIGVVLIAGVIAYGLWVLLSALIGTVATVILILAIIMIVVENYRSK